MSSGAIGRQRGNVVDGSFSVQSVVGRIRLLSAGNDLPFDSDSQARAPDQAIPDGATPKDVGARSPVEPTIACFALDRISADAARDHVVAVAEEGGIIAGLAEDSIGAPLGDLTDHRTRRGACIETR